MYRRIIIIIIVLLFIITIIDKVYIKRHAHPRWRQCVSRHTRITIATTRQPAGYRARAYMDTYNNNNIPTMCLFVELENDCKKYVKKRRFGIRPQTKQIFGGNSRVPQVPSTHSDRLIKQQPQTRHVYAPMPRLTDFRILYRYGFLR